MRYVECSHCQKRYPSNRKFEKGAEEKKSVRCPNCKQAFQIVVYEVIDGEARPLKIEPPRSDEKFLSTIIRKARID